LNKTNKTANNETNKTENTSNATNGGRRKPQRIRLVREYVNMRSSFLSFPVLGSVLPERT
jgi:hypothetical protein